MSAADTDTTLLSLEWQTYISGWPCLAWMACSLTNAPLHTRQDFQLVSLKLLAEQLLLSCPTYEEETRLPLYIPGDITLQPLRFSSSVVLYASTNNPGAAAVAAVLAEGVHALSVTESPPALVSNGGEGTHFLLYLSHETYVGEKGDALAEEVRQARAANLPLVMLHENDMANGGCEFARFFGVPLPLLQCWPRACTPFQSQSRRPRSSPTAAKARTFCSTFPTKPTSVRKETR